MMTNTGYVFKCYINDSKSVGCEMRRFLITSCSPETEEQQYLQQLETMTKTVLRKGACIPEHSNTHANNTHSHSLTVVVEDRERGEKEREIPSLFVLSFHTELFYFDLEAFCNVSVFALLARPPGDLYSLSRCPTKAQHDL